MSIEKPSCTELFQNLLSATCDNERQLVLKKYNDASLTAPNTLTEIFNSKYEVWMDKFIESIEKENLNDIEMLLKVLKNNNAENVPKHFIQSKLLSDQNKNKFYSLLVSSFERRKHKIDSLYIEVECQLKLWLPLCKENIMLSFLLVSASRNSINQLINLIKSKIIFASSTTEENELNILADDKNPKFNDGESLTQTTYELIENEGEKYQFLIYHINKLKAVQNMYMQIQNFDKTIVLEINRILYIYQQKLFENRMLNIHNLVINSILCEEWGHFKDPRDKFKRCSNGLTMYIVNISTLCSELNDFEVYANIFIQIFEKSFSELTLLYVELINIVSRARVLQYRIDVLVLIILGLHFVKTIASVNNNVVCNRINEMLNKLMITLTLFIGPPDAIIEYLRSGNETKIRPQNSHVSFLQREQIDSIFHIESLSMAERFQCRHNADPIKLVQTFFSKKITMNQLIDAIDSNHPIWTNTLMAAIEHTNYTAVSKADSILIVSSRHEFQSVEYPPLTEDDEITKKKLNEFFKSIGNSKTV